jgi:hypothetical protein
VRCLWELTVQGEGGAGRVVPDGFMDLVAYQNPDGGFGNALEPDLRGPASRSRSRRVASQGRLG